MIGKWIVDERGKLCYVLCECNQWPHASHCPVVRVISHGTVHRVGGNDYFKLEARPFAVSGTRVTIAVSGTRVTIGRIQRKSA